MQTEEVRDAEVAVFDAPSGAGQAGTAVGRADRMGARDADPAGRMCALEVRVRRPRHETAGGGADDGDDQPEAQRPAERTVLKRCRHTATAAAILASVCTTIARPMIKKSAASSGVPTLK